MKADHLSGQERNAIYALAVILLVGVLVYAGVSYYKKPVPQAPPSTEAVKQNQLAIASFQKLTFPPSVSATDANPNSLPQDLAILILPGTKSFFTLRDVVFDDGRAGYAMVYIMNAPLQKAYGDFMENTRDIPGWKMVSAARGELSAFAEFEVHDNYDNNYNDYNLRVRLAEVDAQTTRFMIDVIK